MSGIYIHIPFCKQSCSYCDFHFSTSLKYKPHLIQGILREIELRKTQLTSTINTLYFGGGTPSLLNSDELSTIVECINKHYNLATELEFTVECNPDDISQQKLRSFKDVGVNRLSVGVQSFNDSELQFFNRAHNANEAEGSIKRSQDSGFENISIDLIYGSPLLTDKIWLNNIEKVNQFEVPHLSAYGLTVEPKTKLAHQIELGKCPTLDDEKMVEQLKTLMAKTKQYGLIQYEISNFGKAGFFANHNSNYWKGKSYLGIGPSAHSYLKGTLNKNEINQTPRRIWNVSNNIKYINALLNQSTFYEEETIDEKKAFNEYILTRLRTIWGIDIKYIKDNFNATINAHFSKAIQPYLNSSHLKKQDNLVTLNQQGVFIADKITEALFFL